MNPDDDPWLQTMVSHVISDLYRKFHLNRLTRFSISMIVLTDGKQRGKQADWLTDWSTDRLNG